MVNPSPHVHMDEIVETALHFGRTLMECGGSVRAVQETTSLVAQGLGARPIGIRTGYASLALTIAVDERTLTRMVSIGRHGVNMRLDNAVRMLATEIAATGATPADARQRLLHVIKETPRHPPWLVALATGIACAAFGRLLGMDWPAFLPVLAGGTIGQYLRHHLLSRGTNVFVAAAIVAFVAALTGGLGATLLGSVSRDTAAVAAILLLVPGVPATNAQTDIMDGYPTMGSARAVWVTMVMIFAAVGFWCAEAVLRGVPW
ncbi:MAG: threonine/serine exporter family protein [Ancalomicrobiaceae bacterium]|nr:threonine/serine exporter family protein [Ancalomicrobiaceae bacterium]